ncbi:SDR family oxidoreductase [Winogradskyella sp.]|uniref:SDR family oxidoreductase n=1 Tax=Winogradskyella sp. TaxID=1883156 RepID=UPI001B0A8A48|nr:SDR family oxidoreductase [Winogradskyella sp.]MBO6879923.1 SDR family oxidoreductase [Winogradskyella sp.]
MNLFKDIENRIVIVTGGYGHLGATMCEVLSDYGAKVYVAGRRKEKFDDRFNAAKGEIKFIKMDVQNRESITNAFQSIYSTEKRIDVLINNAHFGATDHPEKLSADDWRIGMEGGINHYFDTVMAAIPFLKKSKNGKIINIASMYGVVVPDLDIYEGREELLNPANYGTSKAAVIHLSKYYAMYLAKYNINVNSISPGPFPSESVQKDKDFVKRLEEKTKLKRIGNPEDLKGIILLLSSNASSFITGQNIVVDGGWTI